MAVKKVNYNDTFIYIDDEVDETETGIKLDREKYESDTKVIEVIDEDMLNDNTVVNLFGGNNE